MIRKPDLVESVREILGGSTPQAEKAVEAVLNGIAAGLKQDGQVQVIGFGKWRKARRRTLDPQTRKPIEYTTVVFSAGTNLKQEIQ